MAHATKQSTKTKRIRKSSTKKRVALAHTQRLENAKKQSIKARQIKEALEKTKKKEDLYRSADYINATTHLYMMIR